MSSWASYEEDSDPSSTSSYSPIDPYYGSDDNVYSTSNNDNDDANCIDNYYHRPFPPPNIKRKKSCLPSKYKRALRLLLIVYSIVVTLYLLFNFLSPFLFSSIFAKYVLPRLDFSVDRFQILDFSNDGGSLNLSLSLNDEIFRLPEASHFQITADCVTMSYNHDKIPLLELYPESAILVEHAKLHSGNIHFKINEDNILNLLSQKILSQNMPFINYNGNNSTPNDHNILPNINDISFQFDNLTVNYNCSILSYFLPINILAHFHVSKLSQSRMENFEIKRIQPKLVLKKLINLLKTDFLNISNESVIQFKDILDFKVLNYDYSISSKKDNKKLLTTNINTEIDLFNNSNSEALILPDFTFNKFKFDLLLPNSNPNGNNNISQIKLLDFTLGKFTLHKSRRRFNISINFEIPQISQLLLSSSNDSNSISVLNRFILNLLSSNVGNFIYLRNSIISNNPFWISRIFEKSTIHIDLNYLIFHAYPEFVQRFISETTPNHSIVKIILDSLIFIDVPFLDLQFLNGIKGKYTDVITIKNSITDTTWTLNNQSISNDDNGHNYDFLNSFSFTDIIGKFTISEIDKSFSNIEHDLISVDFDGGLENFQSLIFHKYLIKDENFSSLNYNITSHNSGVVLKILNAKKINELLHKILRYSDYGQTNKSIKLSNLKFKLSLNEFTIMNFDLFESKHCQFRNIEIPLVYDLTIRDLQLFLNKVKNYIPSIIDDEDKDNYNFFKIESIDYISSTQDSIILKTNIQIFLPSNWSSDTHFLRISTGCHSINTVNDLQLVQNIMNSRQNAMLLVSNTNDVFEDTFLRLDYFTNFNNSKIDDLQLGYMDIQNFQFDSTLKFSNLSVILNLDPFSYYTLNNEIKFKGPLTLSPHDIHAKPKRDVKAIVRKFLSDIISNKSPMIKLSTRKFSSFPNIPCLSESLANLNFSISTPSLRFTTSPASPPSREAYPSWPFLHLPPGFSDTDNDNNINKKLTEVSAGDGIILNVIFHVMSSEVQLLIHNPILNSNIHIIILEAETMYMKPPSALFSYNYEVDLLPLAHLATDPVIELNIPANTNYLSPRLAVVFDKRGLRVLKDALSHGISSIDIVSKSFFLLKINYFEIALNYTGVGMAADIVF